MMPVLTHHDELRADLLDVLHEDELDLVVLRVELQPVRVQLGVAILPGRVKRTTLRNKVF